MTNDLIEKLMPSIDELGVTEEEQERIMDSVDIISNAANVFDRDYYNLYISEIGELKNIFGVSDGLEFHKIFKTTMYNLFLALNTSPEIDIVSISTILGLLMHPLWENFTDKWKNKSYESFNIRIDFFTNLRDTNSDYVIEGALDKVLYISRFEFTKQNKLKTFTLHNHTANISQVYNKDYKIVKVIFADGEEVKIPTNL